MTPSHTHHTENRESSGNKRLNILWICTDQQRYDTVHCLGDTGPHGAQTRPLNLSKVMAEPPGFSACTHKIRISPLTHLGNMRGAMIRNLQGMSLLPLLKSKGVPSGYTHRRHAHCEYYRAMPPGRQITPFHDFIFQPMNP